MSEFAVETAAKRLSGERPSRVRALTAACITAVTVGALTYKLLRSGAGAE